MQEATILRNNYRLERLLGRGGMADVYLAFDQRRQAYVAIKVLREDLAEDPDSRAAVYAAEAEALARLEHPNIVRFYSFERQGATAFIVMDYVPGSTLQLRLAETEGPLALEDVTAILRRVGAALQFAHTEGYIHRDIKPGNIMLREDGNALLSDFGIARATESATQTTLAIGSPAYMSPEQILGRELDRRTDIYSLGIVLYEMMVGRRPFTGEESGLTATSTLARLREAHLRLAPPDPRTFNPALPPSVAEVIMRALAKEPSDRWPDVLNLTQAWEAAVRELGGTAPVMAATSTPPVQRSSTNEAQRLMHITPAVQAVPPARVPSGREDVNQAPRQPAGVGGPSRVSSGLVWFALGAAAICALGALVVAVLSLIGKPPAAISHPTPTVIASPSARVIVIVATPTTQALPTATLSPSARVIVATSTIQTLPTATRRPISTLAPTLTPRLEDVYTAGFNTVSTEWNQSSDADVQRSYSNGKYHVIVTSPETTGWSTPGRSFMDFVLEVDATQVEGPDDNGYGVLFRHVDNQNFYYFEISGDGYWEFSKQEDDTWVTLIKWVKSSAIKQGKATNRIKVACDGGAFSFFVNDAKLDEYFDDTFTEGDVGLSVSAYEVGGVHIAFDNLSVKPLTR